MTRLVIITAVRHLASKNQIQLVILEFGDSGHQNRKFSPYTVYANVGQLKVNNNRVMCQMSMKLPAHSSKTICRPPPYGGGGVDIIPDVKTQLLMIPTGPPTHIHIPSIRRIKE